MSDNKAGSKSYDIAVIGCGLMGSALARAFASKGFSVAAWNRTPERAEALAGDGITALRSIDDAVRSSRLAVACTSTYDAMLASLDAVTDWWGVTLVNVGSGSPEGAAKAEHWVNARGANYLDGAVLCYPQQIGTPDGFILFSGSPSVWEANRPALMALGDASCHVSDRVGGANVLDAAIVASFYVSALSAYVEAATYARSQGVSAEALRMVSISALDTLRQTTEEAAAAIDSGNHDTDQATLEVYAEGARTALASIQAAGHRSRLLEAAVENLTAAEAAGLGSLGFYAQTKIVSTEGI
ncbi:NAD(P)-dependent oxidoreductase [Streptomyces boluensis]|uniref:NAD(P)-binding domain-containing protein n=1 Tax=Streptomyces boluensis TaxID=1775135 RepID=A0A964XIF9_9ACTN|nr:NAD(P)-binding domain-containing protein [Streptomyces boluensis]NBE50005.1 NAD(P)-binding domain-containing protein [Streptomyces boluensis]